MIFTAEMKSFIVEFAPGHHHCEIMDAFNEKFADTTITKRQVSSALKRYNVKTGFDGRFRKCQAAYNKGKKQVEYMGAEAIEKTKATRFKAGNIPKNHRPVGSMRRNVDGYNEIKIAEPNKWELYSRYVYRSNYGEIPKGCVVIHVNGKSDDDRIENLRIISRSAMARLNQSGLFGDNEEINETAIAIAKINDKIGIVKRRENNEN